MAMGTNKKYNIDIKEVNKLLKYRLKFSDISRRTGIPYQIYAKYIRKNYDKTLREYAKYIQGN